MPGGGKDKLSLRGQTMVQDYRMGRRRIFSHGRTAVGLVLGLLFLVSGDVAVAQKGAAWRDPVEPAQGAPKPKVVARPTGAVARASVDEKSMRALIDQLVACGTRLSIA